jgi:phage-related protein
MKWTIDYYSEKLQKQVLSLPKGLLAHYLRMTNVMLEEGPDLGMPHSRAMKDGLFEIRLKAREGIARVFYCTLVGKKIVMLHCFIKKQQETPPKELKTARDRLKEVKENA